MGKKGFTLIELMAVITILVIISLIIIPVIDKNVKKSSKNMYNIQIENIRMAGINYFSDNYELRPLSGWYSFVSLDSLIDNGYITDVVNPITGESFDENVYVQLLHSDDEFIYSVCPFDDDCVPYQQGGSIVSIFSKVKDINPGAICGDSVVEDYDNNNICYIDSVEDLVEFSNLVNDGHDFKDKTVVLNKSLDILNERSYVDPSLNNFGDVNGNGVVSDTLMEELSDESSYGFPVIGSDSKKFAGIFDGNANVLKNIYINRSDSRYVGLFGYNSGTIKGLVLRNINIIGKRDVGAIAGKNSGSITGCAVDGNVTGSMSVALGLGNNDSGVLEIVVSGNVICNSNSDPYVGGVVGSSYLGSIKGVFTSGSVVVDEGRYNSRYAALAYGDAYSGSRNFIVSDAVLFNYESKVSSDLGSNNGLIVDDAHLKNIGLIDDAIDTYIGGDNNGDGYYYDYDSNGQLNVFSAKNGELDIKLSGKGTTDKPYIINSISDLKQLSYSLDKVYKLNKDLDFSNTDAFMLSTNNNPFTGEFIGNGHFIKNYNVSGYDYAGIFGKNSGIIRDLSVSSSSVVGNNNIGGLVGYNSGVVKGINMDSISVDGGENVGGIVGNNYRSSLTDSMISHGSVTASKKAGLACGNNEEGVILAVVSGDVSTTTTDDSYVGGLLGFSYLGSVKGVFTSGSISSASSSYVDRTVGYSYWRVITASALETIQINGNVSSCSDLNDECGKSYSTESLATSTPYEEVGFNFSGSDPSVNEYKWFFEDGALKFQRN